MEKKRKLTVAADDDHGKKVKTEELEDQQCRPESEEPADLNPFLLNTVMKVIMSQLTIEDLKMARGVSSSWNHFANWELQQLNHQMRAQELVGVDKFKEFVKMLENSSNKSLFHMELHSTLQLLSIQRQSFYKYFQPKSLMLVTEEGDTNINSNLIKIFHNSSKHLEELYIEGPVKKRQFGGKIKWPKSVKFYKLRSLFLDELLFAGKDLKEEHFLFKNILFNAPNLKSLNLHNHQEIGQLCDLLSTSGIILKLSEFRVKYAFGPGNNFVDFSNELAKMVRAGMKLSKLGIWILFYDSLPHEVIAGYLEKLKVFLSSQAESLLELKIYLDIDEDTSTLSMPPLPRLTSLEIGNRGDYKGNPFRVIDLPSILPKLREIIININFDSMDFSGWTEMFQGSVESVQNVTVKNSSGNFSKKAVKCLNLDLHFPFAVSLDLDISESLEDIGWKTSLRKLALHSQPLEDLKLGQLKHLKGLYRLELIDDPWSFVKTSHLDYKALDKTTIRSLKIKYYRISDEAVNGIRRMMASFDYNPSESFDEHLND